MPRLPDLPRGARRDALVLAALAFAAALAQRPGVASSDTKIDLHVDPVGFLADVASVWSPTGDLGHVHAGQYAGYLFPMGPFFALGDLLGLAPWLTHRLWLGAVLTVAVVGAARLADALVPRGGSPARLTAGAVFLLNPYVVVFLNRTSITLLAYALLPWMLLAVHRGLRHPRSWWWPAAGALTVAAAGGGVNVAVLAWLLLAPLALLIYEPAIGAVTWRAARAFGARTAACLAVTSLWWVAPVVAHVLFGRDFLPFTEPPGVIWSTTSASEVLRLMGYWTSYIGVGYTGELEPFTSDAGVMLFHPAVLVASLLVPALVAAALATARRWAYAPFFLILLLAGALIVGAGFPDGTPLRRAALAVYFEIEAVQFLRTTYKSAPLLVVAFALLAAAAAPAVWARARWAALPAAAILALSAWPLVRGEAVDSQLAWEEIPPAWTTAAADLDADLPANTRALVLPAQLFATYDWASTVDPILPALSDRPVAARTVLAYADRRAVDLLWTTDNLVQQERAVDGQLPPLLHLLGAGAVVSGADDDRARSGAIAAADAAQELARGGLGEPDRRYGGTGAMPEVARYDIPPGPGIVRVAPAGPPTLVDGSAETLAGLAALGSLAPERPLAYAADRTAAELRAAARAGADLVIGDGNRRRVVVSSRTGQEVGPTLTADAEVAPDAAILDPFQTGPAAQTVAVYDGVRDVREDALPGVTQFPESRPFAALDGSPDTAWVAPPHGDRAREWIEVELSAPRDVAFVELLPLVDARARTTEVEISGRRFAVRRGWNRIRLDLRDVRVLRVRVSDVARAPGVARASGGLAELRIPGVTAREWLRPPRLIEDATRGADLSRSSLTYLLQRTTGATPFRREALRGPRQSRFVRDRGDAETQLARRIAPPAARSFRADGWVTVAPQAPDPALDALAGTGGGRFASSGRFESAPGRRASRAFDGDPGTAWIGPWERERRAWVSWTTPRPTTLRTLALRPVAGVRFPRQVAVSAQGRRVDAAVDPAGHVELSRPLRGRAFRLEILDAAFAPGTPTAVRRRRAVGIADVVGAGARVADPRSRIAGTCGALRVVAGGRTLRLRPLGSVAAFDAGRPLRAEACGDPAGLPSGPLDVTTSSALLEPYWLRLHSPAPRGLPKVTGGGRVTDPGDLGRSSVDGVRLALDGPSRLVLAQSYDRGWRAWCDGLELGAPRPDAAYGNGWAVDGSCTEARFAFAPDRPVKLAMLASGAACLLMLLALVLRATPAGRPDPALPGFASPDRPASTTWGRAIAIGLAAGVAGAALIALRAGPPVAVAAALVVRYGVGARPLVLAAAAVLGVAVPAAYLLFLPADRGGFAPRYASELISAHWLAMAALVLLAFALARMVTGPRERVGAAARRARASRGPAPVARGRERAA
jgi:arabinofuranan 3-O-arabinosyltransferase